MDASLDPGAPAVAPSPAALLLAGPLDGGQTSQARDDHVRHAQALCRLLNPFGVQPTISRHHPRWPPEDCPVVLDGGHGLVALALVVGQHVEARDDPTLDLVENHLAAELDRRTEFAPLDDAGVR